MAGNNNVFVPGGGAPASWSHVQVADGQQQHSFGGHSAHQDRQDFEDLNAAITNIIDVNTSNTAPEINVAYTGQLRRKVNEMSSHRPPPEKTMTLIGKHYHAKTTYKKNWIYIFLYILSILASIAYIVVRIIYISTGEMALRIPSNQGVRSNGQDNVLAGELLSELGIGVGDELDRELLEKDPAKYEGILDIMDNYTYSYWWSIVILAAEIGGFVLVHMSQQMFVRQDTKFYEMAPERVEQLKSLSISKGPLQVINIMVCTYNEPMETVKACCEHLLSSPAPVYCHKKIYIGDDGAKKKFDCSEQKRIMCEEFHRRGFPDVYWVGDRKSLPHQLNGKSSNINHMVLRWMYPHIKQTNDIPFRDILMVMDCDHLVEPEFFAKACAVMLNRENAVCLIPQSFHNEVQPDCFDNSNYNFMFRLMPYYFGAGCCFVTGTNVMVRTRAAFQACRFDENPHGHETARLTNAEQTVVTQALGGDQHRQLFSEVLVAEDIDLGSRVHTLGYRSVFLAEVLAKGEVPRDARSIWKQRSRWASAAHMYILDPSSVFWRHQKNMSFWQKSLYWIPMVLHWTLIWAEPIMFTMPIVCLAGGICPYGIDFTLWITHFMKLATTFAISSYADTLELSRAAIYGQTMARVLFFVNVKAVLNTIMVYTGWKNAGGFKVTQKAGGAAPVADAAAPPAQETVVERDGGGPTIPAVLKSMRLFRIHDAASKLTEKRKACMPWEGTFDFWVLLGITAMNLVAVLIGVSKLVENTSSLEDSSALFSLRGCQAQNVQLVALVFAFIEATPGLLFLMYMLVEAKAAWVMKIWVPLLIGVVSILCILIELRVGIQYVAQYFDVERFADDAVGCNVKSTTP